MAAEQHNERPILFSAPMVRAILGGQKTVTRRIVDPKRLRVRLPRPVSSDLGEYRGLPHLSANVGVHRAGMNQHGAVWVAVREHHLGVKPDEYTWASPYGEPGDRLWVRETWAPWSEQLAERGEADALAEAKRQVPWAHIIYRADGPVLSREEPLRWRPSIFMPRWACRLVLEVVSVRVERLHAMTELEACLEGIGSPITRDCKLPNFAELWDKLNAKRAPWASNPWVYRVEFTRVTS